ncbi:putative flagellar attachment zone protein 1-like [Ditylenchus destructor]|uniref:Flagellar attachment zone protein 1-like n=1 Tax=Ditylenchus destructor TaxID=166010 RepID=A0AAD4MU73_9BILA|nr:putative flagellar attachment zone protein 1-like [Ditylenchus destructor]
MAPIGNQRPPFNNNFAPSFAHPSHQFGQQMPFYPFPPSHYNVRHETHMIPNIISTNVQENANMEKISKLNREIFNLKRCKSDINWKLNKEKKNLEERCAKLYDELRLKDTELKEVKKGQDIREQNSLKEQLAKMEDERNNLLREVNQYKGKASQAKNVTDSLSKNLEEIRGENRKLKLSNERSCREFELKLKQLKSENVAKTNEIAKLNETVAEVKRDYDRHMEDSSSEISKLNDKNKKLEEENEMLKANLGDKFKAKNTRGITDQLKLNAQLKSDLDACRGQLENCSADLRKEREDKVDIVAERDCIKADLTKAKETIKISVERNAQLDIKLNVRKDKCKEYSAEIEKLKQNLVQSQSLKAELKNAKKANTKLRAEYEILQKEANKLHNIVHREWKGKYMKKMSSNDDQGSSNDEDEKRNSCPVLRKRKNTNNSK